MNRLERIKGCLLGGAVGGALGAPVEFLEWSAIEARFGPQGIVDFAPAFGITGAITDDTQMMLFTAEGLLRAYVRQLKRDLPRPQHYSPFVAALADNPGLPYGDADRLGRLADQAIGALVSACPWHYLPRCTQGQSAAGRSCREQQQRLWRLDARCALRLFCKRL